MLLRPHNFFLLFPLVVLMAGCMQLKMLPYLDQALTLQEFGRDKDSQEKYVKNADAKFDLLLAAFDSGEIKNYRMEKDILKAFGPPVLITDDILDDKPVKRSLYRYSIQSKGPKKIYLYYNEDGQLLAKELINKT